MIDVNDTGLQQQPNSHGIINQSINQNTFVL